MDPRLALENVGGKLLPGRRLGESGRGLNSDRYRLERELGQGGMAPVYLAEVARAPHRVVP